MSSGGMLLDKLWEELINADLSKAALKQIIKHGESDPEAPFADVGPAVERMLEAGVDARDICRLMRFQRYEAVFQLLYTIDEMGLAGDELGGMYESLLSADPSGKDARPGSWPVRKAPKKKATKKTAAKKAKTHRSGKPKPLFEFKASYDVKFSRDGALLASAGKAVPLVWDVATGELIAKCETSKNTGKIALSPDGKLLAGFDTSGEVNVCDARTGKRIVKLTDCDDEGNFISFSPDGKHLIASNWVGAVWAWDVKKWSAKRVIAIAGQYKDGLFLSDGSLLLGVTTTSRDEFVRFLSIWKWPPGEEEKRRIPCDIDPDHIALDTKTKRIAVGSYNKLLILDMAKGKLLHNMEVDSLKALAWSPTDQRLAVIDDDAMRLYDSKTWQPLKSLEVQYGSTLAFSPDGQTLAIGSWKKGQLWEVDQLPNAK